MQSATRFVVSRLGGRFFGTSTRKMAASEELGQMVHPNNFQRKLLVRSKMYSRMEEIPDRVPPLKLRLAIDWFRIRVNIGMVVLGFAGCGLGSMYYRHLRDQGANSSYQYQQQIEEWQRQGREERAMKMAGKHE